MNGADAPRLQAAPRGPRSPRAQTGTVAPQAGVRCWIVREHSGHADGLSAWRTHQRQAIASCTRASAPSWPASASRVLEDADAHRSCLLTWIHATQAQSPPSPIPVDRRLIRCPQCQSPLGVVQKKDRVLRAMDVCAKLWDLTRQPATALGVCAGAAVVGTSYARVSSTLFFGSGVTTMWFGEPKLIDVPLLLSVIGYLPLAASKSAFASSFAATFGGILRPSPLSAHITFGMCIHIGLTVVTRGIQRWIEPKEDRERRKADELALVANAEVDITTMIRDAVMAPVVAWAGGLGLLKLTHALGDPWQLRSLLGLADDRQYSIALGLQSSAPVFFPSLSSLWSTAPSIRPIEIEDPIWIRNFVAAELILFVKRLFETSRRVRHTKQRKSRRIQGTPYQPS